MCFAPSWARESAISGARPRRVEHDHIAFVTGEAPSEALAQVAPIGRNVRQLVALGAVAQAGQSLAVDLDAQHLLGGQGRDERQVSGARVEVEHAVGADRLEQRQQLGADLLVGDRVGLHEGTDAPPEHEVVGIPAALDPALAQHPVPAPAAAEHAGEAPLGDEAVEPGQLDRSGSPLPGDVHAGLGVLDEHGVGRGL